MSWNLGNIVSSGLKWLVVKTKTVIKQNVTHSLPAQSSLKSDGGKQTCHSLLPSKVISQECCRWAKTSLTTNLHSHLWRVITASKNITNSLLTLTIISQEWWRRAKISLNSPSHSHLSGAMPVRKNSHSRPSHTVVSREWCQWATISLTPYPHSLLSRLITASKNVTHSSPVISQ